MQAFLDSNAKLCITVQKRLQPQLPESVSEKPVDEDWVTQFFNHCQDVSNETMQSLWARLLAGEVTTPGSFSMRTLALVRMMGKDDADLFTRFCSMVWMSKPHGLTPFVPDLAKARALAGVELKYLDFIRLDSFGLIRLADASNFTISTSSDTIEQVFFYYGLPHVFTKKNTQSICLGWAMLTEMGKELARIAGSTANEEYRSWIVSTYREQGWEVTVPHEITRESVNETPGVPQE